MQKKKSNDSIDILHEYNILIDTREIFLVDDIDNESLLSLNKNLRLLESINSNGITIYLTTDGGDVTSAFSMYDIINSSKSHVEIVCSGGVYSAGTLILQAADVRTCTENAWFLLHQGWWGIPDVAYQHCRDIAKTNERLYNRMVDVYAERLSACTKEDEDKLKKTLKRKMSNEWFLSATEALEIGLIDGIL